MIKNCIFLLGDRLLQFFLSVSDPDPPSDRWIYIRTVLHIVLTAAVLCFGCVSWFLLQLPV